METFPIPAPAFNGRSQTVEAGNAFEWIRQGWGIFILHPGQWVALTVVLLVIFLALSIVPLVGSLAVHLLTPVLGAGMLQACRKAANSETPQMLDLFAGFKHNSSPLLLLGVYYMGGMLLIMAVTLVVGGGSVAGGLLTAHPAGLGVAFGGLLFAMLLSLLLTVPLFMALWFAPALVFFNNMPPVEALKASFNACLKNTLAFIIYGLVVMVLLFFAALPVFLGFLVLIPVLSGSIFVAYQDIFVAN